MRTRRNRGLVVLAASVAVAVAVVATGLVVSSSALSNASSRPSAKLRAEASAAFLAELKNNLAPGHRAKASNATASYYYNWSGYADTSTTDGTFTQVSGSWTVPSVTCSQEDQIDAFWVGLDGYSTSTVEQDGVDIQCFEGTAYYYSWYEMYPSGTVEEGTTVEPGDSISASVSRSGKVYTLSLTDSTHTANSFTATAKCKKTVCLDTSAEWIAERPSYATTGYVPLLNYSSWTLSNAEVNTTGNIASFTDYEISMVDSTDSYYLSAPSSLTGGSTAFTTGWKDSY